MIASTDAVRPQDRCRALFEDVHDGVWVTGPDGRLVAANPALIDLMGYERHELVGLEERVLYADPDDRRRMGERLEREGVVRDVELRLLRRDGREVPCLVRAVIERDGSGEVVGCQVVAHRLCRRERVAGGAPHPLLHDELTQLPNRTAFLERVGRLLARMPFQPGYRFAVLFLDLDRFKRVNHSLSHRAGDELLVQVAERVGELVRPEDIVGRMGGDEFAALLLDVADREQAEAAAARIQDGLARPFDLAGAEVYVSASVGITLSGDGYDEPEELLRDAHTAMHVAQAEGAGGRAVFDGSMHDRAVALLATETELRRALEREEMVLHYQPLVSMVSGGVLGFEALVRWAHPQRGLLPPAEFLAVAEESGLIVPIGEWVLREACATAAAWRAERPAGAPPLIMAVNLSVRQLVVPDLAARVDACLRENGLPGSALRLEITESVFLERSDRVLATLRALAELGVTLCLDDFGTVYSTLAYLRDLPVDSLKIDRSFVGRLRSDGGGEMVETILSLARRLGIRAVAEGVETPVQLEALLRLGCDDAQGFLFSEPLHTEGARALLARGVRRPSAGSP